MRIAIEPNPATAGNRVGFRLEFEEDEAQSPFTLSVFVGGEAIHQFDCPDPPCYDMTLYISEKWANLHLEAHALTTSGSQVTEVFEIAPPDPEPLSA